MSIRKRSEEIERLTLSPLACLSENTRGRKRPEEKDVWRTDFQRDRDRIIHAKSFRRLKQKTQVFLSPEGDSYRTRLTHTLEVSQIARTLSRALRLNEDLTEAIALGHDLGHTPFGHAGERALNMVYEHGFSHCHQSLRVVEFLENDGEGLNLTWEVRNGIVSHTRKGDPKTLEGQVVRYCDQIAYVNHDIEDAIRAGVLNESDLPKDAVNVLGDTKSKRITSMLMAMLEPSENKIVINQAEEDAFAILKTYMYDNVYVHKVAKKEEEKVEKLLIDLYERLIKKPDHMPNFYREIAKTQGIERAVVDYISGMSDEFAIKKYQEYFVPKRWHVL